MAQRDEKKDVSLTYCNKMPKLKTKAVRVSFQRRGGSAQFISSKNLVSDNKFSSSGGQNEFFLNLIGDDELCETPVQRTPHDSKRKLGNNTIRV